MYVCTYIMYVYMYIPCSCLVALAVSLLLMNSFRGRMGLPARPYSRYRGQIHVCNSNRGILTGYRSVQ